MFQEIPIQLIFYYLFSAGVIFSSLMVVFARHPVHAVLFLILAFFNTSGLFLLAGAEFLAFILIVVYVGAVAVFFLFVVMMLDVDFDALATKFRKHFLVGIIVTIIFLAELTFFIFAKAKFFSDEKVIKEEIISDLTNTEQIGALLYTNYFNVFLVSGMILLVGMIAAIVLTLHHSPNVLRQNIGKQVATSSKVKMVKPEINQGVTLPNQKKLKSN